MINKIKTNLARKRVTTVPKKILGTISRPVVVFTRSFKGHQNFKSLEGTLTYIDIF